MSCISIMEFAVRQTHANTSLHSYKMEIKKYEFVILWKLGANIWLANFEFMHTVISLKGKQQP